MRSFYKHFFKCTLIIGCVTTFVQRASAQMENDGIMIPKNYLCPGVMYMNSSWNNYWEGTYKRTNGNIGNVTTNTYSFMATYGVTNNLIATVGLPYITTHATAGTLHNQSGIQDLSLNVKWKAFTFQSGSS